LTGLQRAIKRIQAERGCTYRQAWCWAQLDALAGIQLVIHRDMSQDAPEYDIDHDAWLERGSRAADAVLEVLNSSHLH
jgi:hypothetical protein